MAAHRCDRKWHTKHKHCMMPVLTRYTVTPLEQNWHRVDTNKFTFAEGDKDNHPHNSQVECHLKFKMPKRTTRHLHIVALEYNTIEVVRNRLSHIPGRVLHSMTPCNKLTVEKQRTTHLSTLIKWCYCNLLRWPHKLVCWASVTACVSSITFMK